MGGSSKAQTVGYKYYLGMHAIMCHGPVDKVTRFSVDGKVAWSGTSTGGAVSVNAPAAIEIVCPDVIVPFNDSSPEPMPAVPWM